MTNRQWTTYTGRAYGRAASDEMRVTIGSKAIVYLNGAAFDVLGQPAAVELCYDGNRRIVGIRPADPRRRNAFPVKRQHHNGTYRRFHAAAFFRHFRIRLEGTQLVDGAEFTAEGILELPLDSLINITRGAR
jgi:hypothetical protein